MASAVGKVKTFTTFHITVCFMILRLWQYSHAVHRETIVIKGDFKAVFLTAWIYVFSWLYGRNQI